MSLKSLFAKESKNLIISVVAAVLALSAIGVSVVTVLSNASLTRAISEAQAAQNQELSNLIQEFQDKYNEAQSDLANIKAFISERNTDTDKVYKMGETVTVYDLNRKLFDIAFTRKGKPAPEFGSPSYIALYFNVTNYLYDSEWLENMAEVRFYSLSDHMFHYTDHNSFFGSLQPNRTQETFVTYSGNMSIDYIYLLYAGDGSRTFAIFEA
jgi:hypothetical protein